MEMLLKLMLFVYYKYTVHLIPKDLRRQFDIAVEEITTGDPEAAEAVAAALIKVDIAKKQRKPLLVDQDGQSISSVRDSTESF